MVKTGCEERFKVSAVQCLEAEKNCPRTELYFFKKQMRSRHGVEFSEPLFPGYVFLETERLDSSLVTSLRQVSGFYHFLFTNDAPRKLGGYDLEYFTAFRDRGELLGLSNVTFDKEQRIVIISGPLKGFEGNIIRVNRRCKRVTVALDLFGDTKRVDLCYNDVASI